MKVFPVQGSQNDVPFVELRRTLHWPEGRVALYVTLYVCISINFDSVVIVSLKLSSARLRPASRDSGSDATSE
jgi:hypothetical protein